MPTLTLMPTPTLGTHATAETVGWWWGGAALCGHLPEPSRLPSGGHWMWRILPFTADVRVHRGRVAVGHGPRHGPMFALQRQAAAAAAQDPQLQAMAARVAEMFPHVPQAVLAQDLAMTRSVEVTVDNVLQGRLVWDVGLRPACCGGFFFRASAWFINPCLTYAPSPAPPSSAGAGCVCDTAAIVGQQPARVANCAGACASSGAGSGRRCRQ